MSKAKEFLDSLPDPRLKDVRALATEMLAKGDGRLDDQLKRSTDLGEAGLLNLALMLHQKGDDDLWNRLGLEDKLKDDTGPTAESVKEESTSKAAAFLNAIGEMSAAERDKLQDSDFALPGRKYPIHDIEHARNALSRVAQNGTAEEKEKVRAAVHKRYPSIGSESNATSEAKVYWTGKGWGGMEDAECYDSEDDARATTGAKEGGTLAKDDDGKWCVWKDARA